MLLASFRYENTGMDWRRLGVWHLMRVRKDDLSILLARKRGCYRWVARHWASLCGRVASRPDVLVYDWSIVPSGYCQECLRVLQRLKRREVKA